MRHGLQQLLGRSFLRMRRRLQQLLGRSFLRMRWRLQQLLGRSFLRLRHGLRDFLLQVPLRSAGQDQGPHGLPQGLPLRFELLRSELRLRAHLWLQLSIKSNTQLGEWFSPWGSAPPSNGSQRHNVNE